MLAVDAFGKAGGQCIQRRGSLRVLRNITIPIQRLASTQNPQRFVNSRFFTSWAFLDASVRDEWDIIGSNIVSKNGWGDERYLSGREAYVRLNSLKFPYSAETVTPIEVDYFTPIAEFGNITLNSNTSELTIPTIELDSNYFFQIKALRLRSSANNPNISKLKTFTRIDGLDDTAELYDLLVQQYGTVNSGQIYSIAVRGISQGGFSSIWTQQTVIAT